ncbi:lipoprotein-releasing ABC transporter ATP-binding protein LolD [Microlunatus spumicola]|uniref:Lipoprotein-releasing ABC transporter ATP-binding protein LolD n=1 Tax=Microlunatus spumicola TaxID=81499 RepID=A0ABP6WP38_9ACTN
MTEDGRTVLEARGIRVSRGGTEVLRGVDLALHAGERLALTGPSGSGKTVLLSILAGLAAPSSGAVLLDGRPLDAHGPDLRARMGLVFQGYGLVALLTAAENVELPLLAARVRPSEARDRAQEALATVGLADRAEHLVEELSGGQQQRAAVARALVVRPDVLLADEPTAEQDAGHRASTLHAILDAASTGSAVLLATHDPVVAARCDRVVHLEAGLLRESTHGC